MIGGDTHSKAPRPQRLGGPLRPPAAEPSIVAMPGYDRDRLEIGIVHFGVGGFHRAHQAMYLDRLMNAGEAFDWAICGVGVMQADRSMQQALRAQRCLYTLMEKHPDGSRSVQVIGSIVDHLYAPKEPDAVLRLLAAETTRIVSLTITEGGYGVDDLTGDFNPRIPTIARDLEPGSTPRGVFGLITEALALRRSRGIAPFTVLSCDNLSANGQIARRAMTSFARLRDPELACWMEQEVRFPNSMVDRITPTTTEADREQVRSFGLDDRWPVVCEPYAQWVLEDSFRCGRPAYERAGVQVVNDVEPYELLKLRLLNASHQALCYFGRLYGYELVHQAAQDQLFQSFLRGYIAEALPTLDPVPSVDLDRYACSVIERFCNAEIRDTIARLCADASDRIPKFVLPVLRQQIANGGEIAHTAAILASWARYAEGMDEQGRPIVVIDSNRERLMTLASRQRQDPLAFISNRELFGDLIEEQRFLDAYEAALRSLHDHGVRATLQALIEGRLVRGASAVPRAPAV